MGSQAAWSGAGRRRSCGRVPPRRRSRRTAAKISDSLLSRQASTLEQAGYIAIRKGHVGKWPRTWLKLTPEGRTAFNDHLATLREIVETPTNAST